MEPADFDKLKAIIGELETGMICYIHRQTGESICFPDPAHFPDTMYWQTDINTVANNPDDYVAIRPMSSRASFQIMEDFVEEVPSDSLSSQLRYALGHPKPLQRFKQIIDESGQHRQDWFAFRDARLVDWVQEQLGGRL